MSKVKKYSLVAVVALLLCVSFLLGELMLNNKTSATVNADVTTVFEMEEGASARLTGSDGLRFRVKMDESTKNSVDDSTNELSVIIMSKEVYDAGVGKGKTNADIYEVVKNQYCQEIQILKNSIYKEGNYWYGNAVLTGVQEANRKMNFAAFAKLGNTYTGNYTYNNLYNVVNSAFNDSSKDYTGYIIDNTSYNKWFGTADFPVVFKTVAEKELFESRGISNITTLDSNIGYFGLNKTSETYTLAESVSGTITTSNSDFTATASGTTLTVSCTSTSGITNGNVLRVTNNNGFTKYITFADCTISSAEEFNTWYLEYQETAKTANYTKNVVLTADIDMSSYGAYSVTAGGNEIKGNFSGVLDGQGFIVKNITTNGGLFYCVKNAVIKNIAFIGFNNKMNYMPMIGYWGRSSTFSNVYIEGMQTGRVNQHSTQQQAFYQGLQNCSINNVVISADRECGTSSTAAVNISQYNTGNNAKNFYVIDASKTSAAISGISTSNGFNSIVNSSAYNTAAKFASDVKSLSGFDSDYWRVGLNGGVVFKGVGETLEMAKEIGIYANKGGSSTFDSTGIPADLTINLENNDTVLRIWANGNDITSSSTISSGSVTIHPSSIYTNYGANDYLIKVETANEIYGYKLVLATYAVSNKTEFKYWVNDGVGIDAKGELFDGYTSNYAWPTEYQNKTSYVIVTEDIDASGESCPRLLTISGKIDGRGHIISGFNAQWNGLIYKIESTGVLKNIAFTNVKLSNGSAKIGGSSIKGKIENCYFEVYGGGESKSLFQGLYSAIIKNVVIYAHDLGTNTADENNEKYLLTCQGDGSTVMSDIYIVTTKEYDYLYKYTNSKSEVVKLTDTTIFEDKTLNSKVYVYDSVSDFNDQIEDLNGFDSNIWGISPNYGLMLYSKSNNPYEAKSPDILITSKGFTVDNSQNLTGFNKVYKKTDCQSGQFNLDVWTDYRNKYDAWGCAVKTSVDVSLCIGPKLKANTWYYLLFKASDTVKDGSDKPVFEVYLSTIAPDATFTKVLGASSGYVTNGNYTPCIREALKMNTTGSVNYDLYITDIYVKYISADVTNSIVPSDGNLLMNGDSSKTYTETYFNGAGASQVDGTKKLSSEILDGFGTVYQMDFRFNYDKKLDTGRATALIFGDWGDSDHSIPPVSNSFETCNYAIKSTKSCFLGGSYWLNANTWYYILISGGKVYISTDNINFVNTGISNAGISGSIMQLKTFDYVDEQFTLYITDMYGTLKA